MKQLSVLLPDTAGQHQTSFHQDLAAEDTKAPVNTHVQPGLVGMHIHMSSDEAHRQLPGRARALLPPTDNKS